jgi:hypothetical protein
MNNEKTETGLEALASKMSSLPAKASSPVLFIIHYPFIYNIFSNFSHTFSNIFTCASTVG